MGKTFTSGASKILVACLLLATTGCVEDVVWLPDSSGFIYTNQAGTQVLHFDIKRRAKRIVLSHMGENCWPGLSADGKRVAVADHTITSTEGSSVVKDSLTITIYSLEGEQLKRSKPFTRTFGSGKPAETSSVVRKAIYLDWSGPANKLLVFDDNDGLRIYDTVHDKFSVLQDILPWLPGSGSSVTPDKKGFLGFKKKTKGDKISTRIVFCDWDGWETDFEGDNIETILGQDDPQILDLVGSHWVNETTCVIEAEKGTITVDLLKKTATASSTVRPSLPSTGSLVWRGRLGEKAELCAYYVSTENTNGRWQVEIQIPSERKRRVVLAGSDEYILSSLDFFPSPDGSLVAITASKVYGSDPCVIVVDAMGNIVANIPTD